MQPKNNNSYPAKTAKPFRKNRKEKPVQDDIMRSIGSRPDCRLFRNNVGQAYQGQVIGDNAYSVTLKNPKRIKYGLTAGSSDLIGWHTVKITPDMVGQNIAVFLALEVKRPGRITSNKKTLDKQRNFIKQVKASGGIAGIVRDVRDAEMLVGRR